MTKTYENDLRKITILQNKFSLIEVTDNLDTIYIWDEYDSKTKQKTGRKLQKYNEKIVFTVNEKSKTGQASFFLDMDEALKLAYDVVNNDFQNTDYTGKGAKGFIQHVGGIGVYREFNIGYKADKDQYLFNIKEFKALPPKPGQATQKADDTPLKAHSTLWKKEFARTFFRKLILHIESKYPVMALNPLPKYADANASNLPSNESGKGKVQDEPKNEKKEVFTEPSKQTLDELFGGFDV